MIFISSGSYGWSLGRLGEEATAEVVMSSARERQGWRLVSGLYFDRHGDVDQVLIGPGGVFAVESKFTTGECRLGDGKVLGMSGREPIAQALAGAEKVQRMLRYGPGRFNVTVRPVVVMWGPGRVRMYRGWQMVSDVLLCDGPESDQWLPELDGGVLDQETIEGIEGYLLNHLERQVSVTR
jgi:hypothetical protein